ncbi:MAG: transglutaminase family protein, partial [Microbacterium sp.]
MKRLRVEHATGFSYQGDVTASYNEARMLPSSTDSQFVLSSALDIEPSTSVNQYVDYFGTRVAAFDVLSPHSDLKITARSLVEVRPRPMEHTDITWEALRRESGRSIETVEQLGQTARTRPHEEVAEIARAIAAQHERPGHAAHAIAEAIGDAVEYMHGITGVHSTASDAWDARKGVCQDIAHITLGALREVGIPARYVSGYLHPRADA